jgi:hypothetical protein
MGLAAGAVANLLVLGALIYAAVLHAVDPEFYYASVQEDEYLEWGTFWAFFAAAGAFALGALRQRRAVRRFPWFLLGVGLFCFVVAMEEISWGQRLVGYRPPTYFLEHNFQQELNVHNVVGTPYRKLALKVIIAGYGVALPLLAILPPLGRLLTRAGLVAPPAALVPAFLAALLTYNYYPWKHSGEWVELMLGLGFLFAALVAVRRYAAGEPPARRRLGRPAPLVIAWSIIAALGLASAAASRHQRGVDPRNVEAARIEAEALRDDFLRGGMQTACGLHKRVYTYVEKYGVSGLRRGTFSALSAQGLPEERASFFIDPWNSPYWIRDKCQRARGRRAIFVYSFGPNRRRDSTEWEIRGDDVGAVILDLGGARSEGRPAGQGERPPGAPRT